VSEKPRKVNGVTLGRQQITGGERAEPCCSAMKAVAGASPLTRCDWPQRRWGGDLGDARPKKPGDQQVRKPKLVSIKIFREHAWQPRQIDQSNGQAMPRTSVASNICKGNNNSDGLTSRERTSEIARSNRLV
jgi:hypothetical protein